MIKGGNGFYVYTWDDNVAVASSSRTELVEGIYTMFMSDTSGADPCQVEYTVPMYHPIVIAPGEVQPSIGLGADNGIIFASTVSGGSGNFNSSGATSRTPSTPRSDRAWPTGTTP